MSGNSTCSINELLIAFIIVFLVLKFAQVNGTEDEINVIGGGRLQKGTCLKWTLRSLSTSVRGGRTAR